MRWTIVEFIPRLVSSSWTSIDEPLPPSASSPIPPFVFLPKLELKPLPDSLKCMFLGPKDTLLVIISSLLPCDQGKELIYVLSDHKGVIGRSVADLKGMSPLTCMHKIHLEHNAKLVRQMQCRLNHHMNEVV